MLSSLLKEMVVTLCRYIQSVEELQSHVEKLNYMTDKRLVDVVSYINENLEKDLSNKSIAQVAFVSEDYIGQFFKTMTNRNLQDYVEDRRLDNAWKMLRTNPQSVSDVSHRVGFKDPAYFSRRFKLKFGVNANAVRQGKAQIV
jgi:YesN/AraC family two-component response regulator